MDFRSFTFSPDQIVVNQGDKVTLHFIGVAQGAHHVIDVQGVDTFELMRGQPYCIICSKQPWNHNIHLPRTLAKHGWSDIGTT